MNENRDKTVDILRGLGIILMIMGHIEIGAQPYDQYFSIWYHAFHMPMFYVISGYFFVGLEVDESTFIGHKARKLLIPYFFWGVFHILYSYVWRGGDNGSLYNSIINFFVDPTIAGVPIAGALWFLPALFWIDVIFFEMNRVIKNRWLLFFASLIVGLCGMIATKGGIHLPMALDSALVGVAFYATGFLIREIGDGKIKEYVFHMKWYFLIFLMIAVTYLTFYNGEVNFRSGVYGNFAITYVNVVASTILLWNLSGIIAEKFNKGIFYLFKEILSSIGRNSIIYVCLNQWMIECIRPAYTSVGGDWFVWQCIIARALTLVTVCFACHVVMKIMGQNSKLRKYVGK